MNHPTNQVMTQVATIANQIIALLDLLVGVREEGVISAVVMDMIMAEREKERGERLGLEVRMHMRKYRNLEVVVVVRYKDKCIHRKKEESKLRFSYFLSLGWDERYFPFSIRYDMT